MQTSLKLLILILFFFTNCYKDQILLTGERHHPTTTDNWTLSLERFLPSNGAPKRKFPVLICHGVIGNRNYFKLREGDSIVQTLREAGYEVWLMDLRSRDGGTKASLWFSKSDNPEHKNFEFKHLLSAKWWFGDKKYSDFSFDEYALKDADTAISYVLNVTGATQLNWIGHSMGGMIAYTRIGTFNEDRIANLVTIGSPFIFEKDTMGKKLKNMNGTLGWMTNITPVVPTGSVSKANANTGLYAPFLKLFYYSENIFPDDELQLKRYSAVNESPKVFKQFKSAVEKGSFSSLDGKINYSDNLKNINTPVFIVAGRRDHLASVSTVRSIYESIGSFDKELYTVSRGNGASEDYGHVDLVIGKNVNKDVNQPIINWLNKRN